MDNTEKHLYRDKYCPKCGTVYKHSGLTWKPKLWYKKLKDWLDDLDKKHYEDDLRGRAIHQLVLEYRAEGIPHPPSEHMIKGRIKELRRQDEEAKKERKRGRHN